LREQLAAATTLAAPQVLSRQESLDGETRKDLLALADGEQVEVVLMHYIERRSACLSTQVALVAASWWQDAHVALEAGLSPALYALAPTERNYGTHPTASSIGWQHALLTALKRYGEAEMTALLKSGRVWLAVHTADFGRDFDYSWRTVAGVDDMCLLGYKAHRATVEEVFGVRPVIISTEGGVYSPEHLAALSFNPTYDEVQWGPRLRDMYAFLEQQGDMLAMCPWTFSDEGAPEEWHNCGWYRANGSARSPVAALRG